MQLLILLWHHFRFYKNKIWKLALTILIPAIFLGATIVLALFFTNGKIADPQRSIGCQFKEDPLLASSPFEAVLNGLCSDSCSLYVKICQNYRPRDRSRCLDRMNDKSLLERAAESMTNREQGRWRLYKHFDCQLRNRDFDLSLLRLQSPLIPEQHLDFNSLTKQFNESTYKNCDFCEYPVSRLQALCNILRGKILYYPKTSRSARKVIEHLAKILQRHHSFVMGFPPGVTDLTNFGSSLPINNNILKFLHGAHFLKECIIPVSQQIVGFESLEDMTEYIRKARNSSGSQRWNYGIPGVWGAVHIETTGHDVVKYNVLKDPSLDFHWSREEYEKNHLHTLQNFIEEGIASRGLENRSTLSQSIKAMPTYCLTRPNPNLYLLLAVILPMSMVFSYFLSPSYFLEQVLTEKSLKLREYLYIMGVSPLVLKLSWIIFYLIFLIPIGLAFSVTVVFLPGSVFERTDPIIVFIIVLAYTLAQLSFCYLLAAFLQSPKRTGVVVGFLNCFFWILAAFTFINPAITGKRLILARVTSLYCIVPLTLSFLYLVSWEERMEGARWGNLSSPPVYGDEYGGLAECIYWLMGDTILYLIVAWYLENVMPGEFGLRHPLYFPILPSYWFPPKADSGKKMSNSQSDNSSDAVCEAVDDDLKPGIVLDKFSKIYSRSKVGVDGLSLTFYEDQVTSFLGHNGAGKSTTMNSIVGLITPSGGSATVHGMNVGKQTQEVRKIIGFVPQYDILYPDLTVYEHLTFFGWLKGVQSKQLKDVVEPLIREVGLENHMNTTCTKLSGGQKRKLSVITAYLGDPKVIIMDEPTSGVDPHSRRAIWDIIQSRKEGKTTILSTHFMDEADLLGDRVAIISGGKLRCSGSPMFLKRHYCLGSQLILACESLETDRSKIKEFVESIEPGIKEEKRTGQDMVFVIPTAFVHSHQMGKLLKKLEENQTELGVLSYGVSEPTMDEVFFKAQSNPSNITNLVPADPETKEDKQEKLKTSDAMTYEKQGLIRAVYEQTLAIFSKKLRHTVLSASTYILQILLPLSFILLQQNISKSLGSSTLGKHIHIWETYRQNVFFIQKNDSTSLHPYLISMLDFGTGPRCSRGRESNSQGGVDAFGCRHNTRGRYTDGVFSQPINFRPTSNCSLRFCDRSFRNFKDNPYDGNTQYCTDDSALKLPHWESPSSDIFYHVPSNLDPTDWIPLVNRTGAYSVGGFQLKTYPENYWDALIDPLLKLNGTGTEWKDRVREVTRDRIVIWIRQEMMEGMMNAWINVKLNAYNRNESPSKILLGTEEANLLSSDTAFAAVLSDIQSLLGSAFLILSFGFGTFGIAIFVQHETATGLKRMQLLCGAKPLIYWFVNLVVDYTMFLVTTGLVMLLLYYADSVFDQDLDIILKVVLVYGLLATTFMYFLSFLFRGVAGLVIFTVVSFLVLLFASVVLLIAHTVDRICRMYGDNCRDVSWLTPLILGLDMIPPFFLCDSILTIMIQRTMSRNMFLKQINPYEDILGWENLGRKLVAAGISSCVLFLIVVVLEHFDMRISLESFGGLCGRSRKVGAQQDKDEDVAAEEAKISTGAVENYPLVVKNVSKRYPGMAIPAISAVSFGVPKGQCFGLLGINGAGKSSLFKILSGFMSPSEGTASLDGRDLFRKLSGWKRLSGSSYCPQENTLFDSLTCRQHLYLFAKLRGIPGDSREAIVETLINEVGLWPHKEKRASQLSGGNQRKLNFALALLSYPPLIFLDEPTTGMDPGARQNAWKCIERANAKGCSVVLTSHSMEECEELCHRLVIMVAGAFKCIGSVQYLKDKFGSKYTFRIRLASSSGSHEVATNGAIEVKSIVAEKISAAGLVEEHPRELHYEIPSQGLRLSDLFASLNLCRTESEWMEDFSVSQTSLEQVFLSMARSQPVGGVATTPV